MDPEILYLVHIHTPDMDHYALRDSPENAREEVFQFAQENWYQQFPGVERPASKDEVIKKYYQSVHKDIYFHVVDISSEGNWVMEKVLDNILSGHRS